ncbi:MAG: glucosaminidase domain-containing protein [Bacteroidota bacterium]
MIKKIGIFLVIMSVVSCTANKSIIQTTKNGSFTPYSPDAKKQIVLKVTDTVKVDTAKTVILAATTRVKVTQEMVLAYIEKYKGISKNNMTEFGIPSSITLAQGILESGAGSGPLSSIANNHFGIKCHKEWNGPSVKYDDDAAQECFRKYEQPDESYKDHSLFLTSRPRYAELFKLEKDDYKGWANGLKAAGYATDSLYAVKLIGIIERYQLGKHDADVLGKEYVPVLVKILPQVPGVAKINPVIINPKEEKTAIETSKVEVALIPKKETPTQKPISVVEKKLSATTEIKKTQESKPIAVIEKKLSGTTTINDSKPTTSSIVINENATVVKDTLVLKPIDEKIIIDKPIEIKKEIAQTEQSVGNYQVMQGDTLYSISKKFNLTVEDLKKKNNILDYNISIGQYLIVQ